MKILKRCAAIAVGILTATVGAGCAKSEDSGMKKWTQKNALVSYSQFVSRITGKNGVTDTTQWLVGGTDLGFPIYNSTNDTMYYAFGDTFPNPDQTGAWRSNTLAISKDFDFSDGLRIDDYYKGPTGAAREIVEGYHDLNVGYEATKIPTGGIEVNGTMYLFYMSIRQWDGWIVNYNGAVKSSDDGASWERVYDLTWPVTDGTKEVGANVGIKDLSRYESGPFAFTKEKIAEDTLRLANQTTTQKDREATEPDYVSLEGRSAPNFGQIFPIDGKDGYIYIMGIPGGRDMGVKVGRVKKENFERFDEYEYFTGKSEDGKPIFVKGKAGLAEIWETEKGVVIEAPCGELSFSYNAYLKKWVSVNSIDKAGTGLTMRVADELWGEWSEPYKICDSNDFQPIAEGVSYGGQIHEKLSEENGKIFYVIVSQWMPTYNSGLIKVVLK